MEKYSVQFTDKKKVVKYITSEKDIFEWICKYFKAYYQCSNEIQDHNKGFCVEYIVDKKLFFDLLEEIDNSNNKNFVQGYLDTEYIKCNNYFVSNDKSHMICRMDEKVYIYTPECNFKVGLISMRIIRDIFSKHHENIGEFVLHSGTVGVNGCGITFVGEKNAGKTTAVLTMLKYLKASFISNDKTYIGFGENDMPTVYGWPTTCSVAMGSFNSFPEMVNYITANVLEYPQYVQEDKNPKIEVTSNEIENIFNVPIVSSCISKFLFFPHISQEVGTTLIKACPVEKAQNIILENILTPHDPHYPDFLGFRDRDEDEYREEAKFLASRLAKMIPCYEIHYGYDIVEMSDAVREFLMSQGIRK